MTDRIVHELPVGGRAPGTLVTVPGGRVAMGDESEWSYPGDGEGPVHDVVLAPFSAPNYKADFDLRAHFSL